MKMAQSWNTKSINGLLLIFFLDQTKILQEKTEEDIIFRSGRSMKCWYYVKDKKLVEEENDGCGTGG